MSSWVIDQFKVKPAGLFARWRFKRVLIDENGILSTSGVPGESETMNLPCISDYRKSERRYSTANLITEYCNLTTHTNYRVYAQECDPFAYVQTDLNAAKCGYLVPLPEPGVPPNPYIDIPVSYGLYKFFNVCDINGITCTANIYKKNFTGTAIEIVYGGDSPIVISYKNSGDDKFSAIRASECNLTFIANDNFALQDFYTEDEREYKVEVLKGGLIQFTGFVIPDSCQEPFINPPYPVSIRATDGLGALKNITFPLPAGSDIKTVKRFIDMLAYCLNMTNLDLDIQTICNLYESKMLNGLNDDPLAQAKVNPLRMSDDNGFTFNCYEVLTEICTLFGAYIAQIKGKWHFIRVNELSNAVIRSRVYNSKGFFLRAENVSNLRFAGAIGKEVVLITDSHSIRIGNAYKRAAVYLKYGKLPTVIFNGGFEFWNGVDFDFWKRIGGIDVSRVQKEIADGMGTFLPIDGYVCRFNQKADPGKWLEAAPIPVLTGDKISLKLNLGKTDGAYLLKMRVKLNDKYLYNADSGTDYTWQDTLAILTIPANNPLGDIDSYTVTLSMPETMSDGLMVIQIYGFTKLEVLPRSGGRPYRGGENGVDFPAPTEYVESTSYSPVSIDNVSVSRSTESKEPEGILSVSDQSGFYTDRKDTVNISYGDCEIQRYLRPARSTGSGIIINDLYAIYTSDNTYSKTWYEYGQSGKPVPIALALARAILKAHQRPFRFFSGTLLGNNLSYLDVFKIEVPGNTAFSERVFSVLSCDLDLFRNEMQNVVMAEVFSKALASTDISVTANPGTGLPPIRQNPNIIMSNNPLPAAGSVGIFTEEFNNQFS